MSFAKEFKGMLDMVGAATGVGEGQVAYAVAAKAVEMLGEAITEVIENADVCDDCRLKLAGEAAKLMVQVETMKFPSDPVGPCAECKGKGYNRGVSPGGTRVVRVKCEACGGTGKP